MTTRESARRSERSSCGSAAWPPHPPVRRASGRFGRQRIVVAERISAPLTPEQHDALRLIAGASRAAILIGPAGTGKGVVIDAAARAEQNTGRETVGVAVSGSTAQRLGRDSPALAGHTLTMDALIDRAERGRLRIDEQTTIYLDEAGMADTARLGQLTELADRTGAKLVLIGDPAQLPSISAGGMFSASPHNYLPPSCRPGQAHHRPRRGPCLGGPARGAHRPRARPLPLPGTSAPQRHARAGGRARRARLGTTHPRATR